MKALKRRGLRSEGHVVATRNATKHILKTAEKNYCDVIVMAADPPRHGLVGDFMWTQEAYRVQRRSPIPVYLLEHRQDEDRLILVPPAAGASGPGTPRASR